MTRHEEELATSAKTLLKFLGAWACFLAVVITLTFLAGCNYVPASPQPWEQPADHLGNPWPVACRQDLAAVIKPGRVEIQYRPREELRRAFGRDADGLTWSFGVQGDEIIWIADDIAGWRKTAVVQHEYCHLAEYGGVGWHA